MSRGRWVTPEKAKEILKELDPWLNKYPPLGKFTEQLDVTVETIWAIHCVGGHYHKVAGALRQLRRAFREAKLHGADYEAEFHQAACEAKNAILEMKASTRLPEMSAYRSLLKLNAFRDLLKATDAEELSVDDLESALTRVPTAFSGRPVAGSTAWLVWYPGFVRDLAVIAKGIVPVRTQGDREGNQHKTAFTTFVYAVEKLLPPETQCRLLSGCAKRIDRAIKNSRRTLGKQIRGTQKSRVKRRAIKSFVV